MEESRQHVACAVACAILRRWQDAGVTGWGRDAESRPVPAPQHAFELIARTTPSGKALFRCLGCGVETPAPSLGPRSCGGAPLHTIGRAIDQALLGGVRYWPDAAGVPRPMETTAPQRAA